MAKKAVSVHVPRWKKQPTKQHINKRRKLKPLLKSIINYLKSDSYLFAPVIHSQSSLSSPPVSSGEVSFVPIKREEKKLAEDVSAYLKVDTYMYAPLVMDSEYDGTSTTIPLVEPDQMEERAGDDEHRLSSSREIEGVNALNPVRRIVVEHSLLQSERVKQHIVHQNYRSLSAAGKVSQQKSKVTDRAHAQLT